MFRLLIFLVLNSFLMQCEEKPIFDYDPLFATHDCIYFYPVEERSKDSSVSFNYHNLSSKNIKKVKDSIKLKDAKLYEQLDIEPIIDDYFPRFNTLKKKKKGYDNPDSVLHHLNYLASLESFQKRFSKCKDCKTLNNFFQKYNIKVKDLNDEKKREWILKLVRKALIYKTMQGRPYHRGEVFWEFERKWENLVEFYSKKRVPYNFGKMYMYKYNKKFFEKINKIPENKFTYLFAVSRGYLLGILSFSINEDGYLMIERNLFNPEVMLYYTIMRR